MVGAVNTYTARAVRWEHGWELHVEGVGVTQVKTLATAEDQVRDLVETMLDIDASEADVVVYPEVGGLEVEVASTKRKAEQAAAMQVEAANESRAEAQALRARGLSVSDIAVVMQVSRGRVSQLLADDRAGGMVYPTSMAGTDLPYKVTSAGERMVISAN